MKTVLQRKKEHEQEIKDIGIILLTSSVTNSLTHLPLELSLETQPRDSKFSSQLIVLMQKEENMLRNDTLSPASTAGIPTYLSYSGYLPTHPLLLIPAAANELLVKINELLNAETRKFFRKNVQANIKKWTNQENKLTKGGHTYSLTHSLTHWWTYLLTC